MYKCKAGLTIVEGPGFMQLEQCGLRDKHSHITATCRTFLGRFPDDDLPESPEDSSDENAEDDDEEVAKDDDDDDDEDGLQ